jgi:hypothetical protein
VGKKSEAIRTFLTEHILNVATDYGKNILKKTARESIENETLELVSTVGSDIAGSMIPGIGPAISAYRTEKKLYNIRQALAELDKKSNVINENLSKKSEVDKIKIDMIMELLLEKASITSQEEKIAYMVNGFVHITKSDNVTFDIAYLYYDTLDRLTLLDIACLNLSYNLNYYPLSNYGSYQDILDEFNIDSNQYTAVRENLERIGLLENQYDEHMEKDFKQMVEAINELYKAVGTTQDALANPKKKFTKVKSGTKIKLKAKDRLKISKFGRDFVKYFLSSESL